MARKTRKRQKAKTLSIQQIKDLLDKAAPGAAKLHRRLKRQWTLTPEQLSLILD